VRGTNWLKSTSTATAIKAQTTKFFIRSFMNHSSLHAVLCAAAPRYTINPGRTSTRTVCQSTRSRQL
jgi:hypothetical protein